MSACDGTPLLLKVYNYLQQCEH